MKTIKKPIIGFDIDDVLGNFLERFIKQYNEEFNTDHGIENVRQWEIGSLLKNITGENINEYILKYKTFSQMIPFIETIKLINELKKDYHIKLITSRPKTPEVQKITEEWLKKHSIYYDSLHIESYKSYLCRDLGISYFIDDNLENIIKISKNSNTIGFLLQRNWNGKNESRRLIGNEIFTKDQILTGLKNIIIIDDISEVKTYLDNKKNK